MEGFESISRAFFWVFLFLSAACSQHSIQPVVDLADTASVELVYSANFPEHSKYPVLFRMIDGVRKLNGKTVATRNGKIYASGQGSLTDSRALFRLYKLTVEDEYGNSVSYEIDGWIVGSDGLRGVRGDVMTKLNSNTPAMVSVKPGKIATAVFAKSSKKLAIQ